MSRQFDHNPVLSDLNDEQVRAVTADAVTLVVIAGAGTGKTRVLTRRIAYRTFQGDADPERTLAVTFTRKAALELNHRLSRLGIGEIEAGTFHSIALRMLKRTARRRPHRVIGTKSTLLARVAGQILRDPTSIREVGREIEWAKARMVPPQRYLVAAANRETYLDHQTIGSIYELYEAEKGRRGIIDFEDILTYALELLEKDVRLSSEIKRRYMHVYVDEFQDLNPLQYRLLSALAPKDLFVVGDPAQSIYSFAGADSGFLDAVAARSEDGEVKTLTSNYRSSPEIIEVANALGAPIGALPLTPMLPEGPIPRIITFEDDKEEAEGIARLLRDQYDPRLGWGSIAILYRVSSLAPPIELALRKLRVPYAISDGSLTERPEIAALLQQLQDLEPGNHLRLPELIRELAREISSEEQAGLDLLISLAEEFRVDHYSSPAQFVDYVRQIREGPLLDSNAVTLMTLHSSKGLEFRTVIVIGCEDGLLPIHHAKTDLELMEERRLLYVGATRARENLVFTCARMRKRHPSARTVSPLLNDVKVVIDRLQSRDTPTRDWRREIARQRAAIAKTTKA